MVKDQEYLKKKAVFCLDFAKKLGATNSSVIVSNSISETVNFRNKKLDESNRSDNLAINITTYIDKKKSSISSSNLLLLIATSVFFWDSKANWSCASLDMLNLFATFSAVTPMW